MTFTAASDRDVAAPAPGTCEEVRSDAPAALRKTVVLDTSVLVTDPDSLYAYPDADVVLPLVVVEELDGHKSRMDNVGQAARRVLRTLETFRVGNGGDLRQAVSLPAGATLRIETNGLHLNEIREHGLDPAKNDNRILAASLGLVERSPVLVVSADAALRIKAAQLGLQAAEHERGPRIDEEAQRGWHTVDGVDPELISDLYDGSAVHVDELPVTPAPDAAAGAVRSAEPDVVVNEFVVLRNGSQSVMTRVGDGGELRTLRNQGPVWGLTPRSKEQRFALELLTDPDVGVVALDGRAGTGKTLLAVAAGLEQVVERGVYDRLAIYRPIVPVGRADVGFLPGTLDEKLDPWMASIVDAVAALTDRGSHRDARKVIDEMLHREQLTMESVTFLRGRSLQRTLVILDEAQNLEPAVTKTVLSRLGEGSKVVLTGDTEQIDAPYLSAQSNALAVLTGAFRGQACFGHVRLVKGERSEVAELATRLL